MGETTVPVTETREKTVTVCDSCGRTEADVEGDFSVLRLGNLVAVNRRNETNVKVERMYVDDVQLNQKVSHRVYVGSARRSDLCPACREVVEDVFFGEVST